MAVLILVIGLFLGHFYPMPVDCRSLPHEPTIAGAPVTQSFGYREHVGVDYGTVKVGSPAYSVMDGIVFSTVQDSRVYGRYVMVLHCDGYVSMYAHLSEIKVKWGEVVRAGQLIGLTGGDPYDNIDGDGQSSGWHLHFEIRSPGYFDNNKHNVDPVAYLIQSGLHAPIRLHQPR